jgi:hypothetical protein
VSQREGQFLHVDEDSNGAPKTGKCTLESTPHNYTLKFKVQVRPWRLSDTDYIPRPSAPLNPRLTVFVGGLPRPTTASKFSIHY